LRDDIGGHGFPSKTTRCRKSNRHRRIQVRTTDVAKRLDLERPPLELDRKYELFEAL
jgi:hypothetical protein